MKVYLYGRNFGNIERLLRERGVELLPSPDGADLILSHGGDGSMLGAEYRFPGRLKFPVRDAETAPLCPEHRIEKQLDLLLADQLKKTFLPKLEGRACGKSLRAVNDIFIHNRSNVCALRYKVWIDGELYGRETVGDGVGVATVHGSTAYYRSITHSIFRTGIGLAFNNSTELVNHLVLPEKSLITVEILRGPGELVADNIPESIPLNEGDSASIFLSAETTPVLGLDCFMCPECRFIRHRLRNSSRNGQRV